MDIQKKKKKSTEISNYVIYDIQEEEIHLLRVAVNVHKHTLNFYLHIVEMKHSAFAIFFLNFTLIYAIIILGTQYELFQLSLSQHPLNICLPFRVRVFIKS